MTRKTIRTIVILMTFAMISLISYQAYWIQNAIEINDIQFRRNVHEALGRVVSRLEKNEVYYTAYQQFNNPVLSNRIFYQDSNWITRMNLIEKNARQMNSANVETNRV
jgi:hypothetical protein